MQHEDRILKSIDLLTYNARETLNKYYLWATTPDSDVTFNLFDALPAYGNGNGTGSGVFVKPIKIPSFNSLSSGIFGVAGTTSDRDIHWNFRFVSNGKGWIFDEYVRSNGGMAPENSSSPVLDIRTDVSFGKTGSPKNITFIDSIINYKSGNASLEVSSSALRAESSSIAFGEPVNEVGAFSANSSYVSIGSNIADFLKSTVTGPVSFTEKVAKRLDVVGERIYVRGYNGAGGSYSVLNSSNNSTTLGDVDSSLSLASSKFEIAFALKDGMSIVTNNGSNAPLAILSANAVANDQMDLLIGHSPSTSLVRNLFIGGNASSLAYMNRLASITSEGFQLFSRSEFNNSANKTSVFEYFDSWIDSGVDSSVANRKTSQYSSIVSGFADPIKTANSVAPFYMNIGTRGALKISGGTSAIIESSSSVSINIDNSPEIVVSKGLVTIPNLNIPRLSNTTLSTLIRSSFLNFNPQVSVFGFGNLKTNVNGSVSNGMEISTDISNNYELTDSTQLYVWTAFNSIDAVSYYYYTFHLINSTSSDTYKLVCETVLGTASGPNYSNPVTTSVVVDNIPKIIYRVGSSTLSKFDRNMLSVVTSGKSVYVVLATRNVNKTDTISLYSSSDYGVSFSKKAPSIVVNSIYSMNTCAISTEDVGCNCGIKDKVWMTLDTSVPTDPYVTKTVIACYNEIGDVILSTSVNTSFDDRVNPSDSEEYIYKTRRLNTSWGNEFFADKLEYSYGSLGLSKVASFYDGTDYYAYVTLVVTNGLDKALGNKQSKIKLLKVNLGSNLTLSKDKDLPLGSYVGSVDYTLIPGELIINKTGSTYALHTIYTRLARQSFVNIPSGHYGASSNVVWTETTNFDTATGFATVTLGQLNYNSDFRYAISQVKGWTDIDRFKVVSAFSTIKVLNSSVYLYSSNDLNATTLLDVASVTFTNASFGINDTTGSVTPIASRHLVVDNDIAILTKYDTTSDVSVNYSDCETYIVEVVKTSTIEDGYAKFFKNSFIDMLGAAIYHEGSFHTLLSNSRYGKYDYHIGAYDTSGIGGKVYVNTNGSDVPEIFLQSVSSTTSTYFKKIEVNNDLVSPVDSTNITLKKDNGDIAPSDAKLPVTIFATCPVQSQLTNTLGRNGVFSSVSSTSIGGIKYGAYDPSGVGVYDAKNVLLLPVEISSIFAKRASQNNKDTIVRSDFTMTFVNSVDGIDLGGDASNFIMATVTWEDVVNSGHMKPWLYDPRYYSRSFDDIQIQTISREAYMVNDANLSIIPYNSTISQEFVLIYDIKYNRTVVLAKTSNYVVKFNTSSINVEGSALLVSIHNAVINPFDKDFNSSTSLVNEAGNVISIGIDTSNTLSIRNVYGNRQPYSSLIMGYTRTNHVEGAC